MKLQTSKLTLVLLLTLLSVAWAALPPRSPEDLVEQASDVVIGTVVEVKTVSERVKYGRDKFSAAMFRIESVEKGKLKPGVLIETHFRQTESRGKGWAGPQGQNEALTKGLQARLYLTKTDGIYQLLEPNGWATP